MPGLRELLRKRRRGGVRRVCVCMRVAEESQRAIWPTPTLVNTVKTFPSGWDTLKKTTDRTNEEINTRIRQTQKLSVHATVLPFFDTTQHLGLGWCFCSSFQRRDFTNQTLLKGTEKLNYTRHKQLTTGTAFCLGLWYGCNRNWVLKNNIICI